MLIYFAYITSTGVVSICRIWGSLSSVWWLRTMGIIYIIGNFRFCSLDSFWNASTEVSVDIYHFCSNNKTSFKSFLFCFDKNLNLIGFSFSSDYFDSCLSNYITLLSVINSCCCSCLVFCYNFNWLDIEFRINLIIINCCNSVQVGMFGIMSLNLVKNH